MTFVVMYSCIFTVLKHFSRIYSVTICYLHFSLNNMMSCDLIIELMTENYCLFNMLHNC